ncbi:hypothetical protein CROQUDRAFT_82690 [Cronartium quercuum f. sp. fusiforme G11]|uniref:Anaphase-promoting complex subunit 5 n=1 Tax=Cronartium quercuum f. sp. fusiforme G11 TaxID=708437 RepID=A0A9P6N9A2_9BASI|nr:hypothetical protein CROQUDRAFT_82690 [Cronartium quercuum f. sp. fusiforme G11]
MVIEIGSTTQTFQIKPIYLVCIALLIEFQSIKSSMKLITIEIQKNDPQKAFFELNHFNKTYPIIDSILFITTQILFGSIEEPKSINQVYSLLRSHLIDVDQLSLHQLINSLNHSLNFGFIGSVDGIYDFTKRFSNLISTPQIDDKTGIQFHLESPIGIFIRRCKLSILNLEFDEIIKLSKQLESFCTEEKEIKEEEEINLNPIQVAYLEFKNDYDPDFIRNSNALRRFYDTRANPNLISSMNNKSIHSQALLSLSNFHYQNQAYSAAYDALEESIRLARISNDRIISDKCTCLKRRLDLKMKPNTNNLKENDDPIIVTGPIQAHNNLNSLRNNQTLLRNQEIKFWDSNEELLSISKSINNWEALEKVYGKLFRAKRMSLPTSTNSLFDEDDQKKLSFDKISWFGLQSKLWYLQGQISLCKVYEELALKEEANEEFIDDKDRSKVLDKTLIICQQAMRTAKSGDHVKALIILLEEFILDRSNTPIKSFENLHFTFFKVLLLKAIHEGDQEMEFKIKSYCNINKSKEEEEEEEEENSVKKLIENLYQQSTELIESGYSSLALCPILRGITLSNKMSLWLEESIGIIKWSETLIWLDDKPNHSSKFKIENVFEKLDKVWNLEILKNFFKHFSDACFIKVRWEIYCNSLSNEKVFEVLDTLKLAEIGYRKIERFEKVEECFMYRKAIIQEGLFLGYSIKELGGVEGEGEEILKRRDIRRENEDLFEKVVNGLSALSAKRYTR